jgi:hypothetical protein
MSGKSPAQLSAEFETFHRENPELWKAIKHKAREYAEALPNGPLSISLIIESLRYDHVIKTRSRDGFKINNNFRAMYSRLLNARKRMSYAGRFQIRESKVDYA